MVLLRVVRELKILLLKWLYNITSGKQCIIKGKSKIRTINNGRISLGNNVSILENGHIVAVDNGNISLGNNVFINENCFIVSRDQILIENNVIMGPGVSIFDHNHRFNRNEVLNDFSTKKIVVGEGSWLGAGCILLKEAQIGKHCVIGAGTVINGVVPDYSIVARNDAISIQGEVRS